MRRKALLDGRRRTRPLLPETEVSPALDAALAGALKEAPVLEIPESFAARVAALAAAQPAARSARWMGWGPRLLAASTAVLAVALFALAPHTSPSLRDLRFDAELLLFAELGGLLLFGGQVLSHE